MNANPLTRRYGEAVKPTPQKPRTAQEAINEMLQKRAADPTAPPPMLARGQAQQSQNAAPIQPKPNVGQAALGAAGTAGTAYVGNAAWDALTNSAPSVPSVVSTGALPSTPSVVSAGAVPSVPNVVSATAAPTAPGFFAPGGAALQGAGVAAGGAVGAAQAAGIKDVIDGEKISPAEQAALFLPTAGLSVLANPIREMFDSGKDPDQHYRDSIRDRIKEMGGVDEAWNLTNADGSKFDIGRDGGDPQYNVDHSREGVGQVVGLANAIAAVLADGDEKGISDFAGYLTNAAMSSGDPRANLLKYAADMGLNHDGMYGRVHELANGETGGRFDAYKNALDDLFGVGAYGSPVAEKKSGGGGKKGGGSKPPKGAPPAPPTPIATDPVPQGPGPQSVTPITQQDYIEAIKGVQAANQSQPPAQLQKKNALMRRYPR